jgi:phage protein D
MSQTFSNANGTSVNQGIGNSTSSLNNPLAPGYANRPRLRVLSNNAPIPGALAARIESNNHFQADRFTLSFVPALNGATGTLNWWSGQKLIPVDIQLGLLPLGAQPNQPPTWTSLLTGVADKMTIEPGRNMVQIEGRDLTANFIDNLNTGEFVNQSSSAIVQSLAQEYGMTAQVTNTNDTVGRYWADGRTISKSHKDGKTTTEWDLIVSLAKKEGYDAFVQGNVLYFQPPTPATATPYTWLYKFDAQGRQSGNVSSLKMDRTLTISKGMHVTVKSWSVKQARAFTKTSSTSASITGPFGNTAAQEYLIQHPNLTEDEAQTYADTTAAELASHELLISATMPGDTLLTPRTLVNLTGTGTVFDQLYYTTSITREIDIRSGFVMHASCKAKAAEDAIEAFNNAQSAGAAAAVDGGVDAGPED